jgi:hypothetical protein
MLAILCCVLFAISASAAICPGEAKRGSTWTAWLAGAEKLDLPPECRGLKADLEAKIVDLNVNLKCPRENRILPEGLTRFPPRPSIPGFACMLG